LVFSAAYRLRTIRRLSRADEISPAAAAEIDAIQALLARARNGPPGMKKLFLAALFLAFMAASTFAGTFRVTYTARGLVDRVTVQAATPYEARRMVQHMFGGYVTGVQQVAR
jgi:hypothetical protein